jgi:pimeloyl-ACP methyl ester carboxylesterase
MQKSVLTIDRFEIPYIVVGEGTHLLICVNGMQQTMASWRSLVPRFTAHARYRVALFDFPNQGRYSASRASTASHPGRRPLRRIALCYRPAGGAP